MVAYFFLNSSHGESPVQQYMVLLWIRVTTAVLIRIYIYITIPLTLQPKLQWLINQCTIRVGPLSSCIRCASAMVPNVKVFLVDVDVDTVYSIVANADADVCRLMMVLLELLLKLIRTNVDAIVMLPLCSVLLMPMF